MLPRFEVKYIVSNLLLNKLREHIEPYTELDIHVEHKETHSYSVRSIYFDTPEFQYYIEKLEGIGDRQKLRFRAYHENTDESIGFLETKRKLSIPLVKFRAPFKNTDTKLIFSKSAPQNLILKNIPNFSDAEENAKLFFYYVHKLQLKPVALVVYEREPYFSKFDHSTRITFDKNLRCSAFPKLEDIYSDESLSQVLDDKFIIEVKYNNTFPFWLKPIISKYELRAVPASKYLMSVDRLDLINHCNKYATISYSRF